MRSSPGLQRKFDQSAADRRKEINNTLKGIREDIHPEFYTAFEMFRKELKGILKTAANDNFLLDELTHLSDEVKDSNGRYNTKLGAAIIDKAA